MVVAVSTPSPNPYFPIRRSRHLILEQPCTGRPTIACSLRVRQAGLFIGILDTLTHKIVELGLVALHDIGDIAVHDVDARTLIALVARIVRDIT